MWRLKLLTQFGLARLPYGEAINYRLGAFFRPNAHSPMVLKMRLRVYLQTLKRIQTIRNISGTEIFEIGTGWCPIAPVLFSLAGSRIIHTVDHVKHLRWGLIQNLLLACLDSVGEIATAIDLPPDVVSSRIERLKSATDISSFLSLAGIKYVAPADARNVQLATESIDIYYSYSVLENIPRVVVNEIITEARRLMKTNGIWFSVIGCQDPFTSGTKLGHINYLQYSDAVWNFWTSNKISHNNRLRERDFIQLLADNRFQVAWNEGAIDPTDIEKLKNLKIANRFQGYSKSELAVYRSEILARVV